MILGAVAVAALLGLGAMSRTWAMAVSMAARLLFLVILGGALLPWVGRPRR